MKFREISGYYTATSAAAGCYLMWAVFLLCSLVAFSQEPDTNEIAEPDSAREDKKDPILDDFEGSVTITHNGISLVPTFSLGDPAMIIELEFTKGKFSFEPDMRFALEGKPWSFVFWCRYEAIANERFTLRIGAHPALNFRTINVVSDGVEKVVIQSRRFVAAEVATDYDLNDHISIGTYYLSGRGLDEGLKQSHFAVLVSSFEDLYISKNLYFDVSPQVYYLWLDREDGFYTVTNMSFNKKDFPFSVGAIFNIKIDSEIESDAFNWNISLIYSF